MVFDITHLRKIRKQLDLTQHQFARDAGISQSMVAKIESGKLDPTYSYVKKIEDAFARLTKREEKTAGEIMHNKIISAGRKEKVREVVKLMASHKISQVPVVEKGNVVGMVSESSLLDAGDEDVKGKDAEDVMEGSPPIIEKNAKLQVAVELLKFYPIVLVKENGKLAGVITKADVIRGLK